MRIVTPEQHALQLLGPAARDAVLPLLDALDIDLITAAQPRAVVAGGLASTAARSSRPITS